MSPIRPEKPEDFESGPGGSVAALPEGFADVGSSPTPGRVPWLNLEGIGRILNDYIRPAVMEHLADSRLGDILFEQAFGHKSNEIKPEFWIWRRLVEVPRESDQCPWL